MTSFQPLTVEPLRETVTIFSGRRRPRDLIGLMLLLATLVVVLLLLVFGRGVGDKLLREFLSRSPSAETCFVLTFLTVQLVLTVTVHRRSKAVAREAAAARQGLEFEREKCKATEEELSLRKKLINALFVTSPEALAVLDTKLRYVQVNQRLAEIHGITIEEHLGKSVAEVAPVLYRGIEPLLGEALGAGRFVWGAEFSTAASTGSEGRREWSASVFPVKTADDQLAGIGISLLDITERKQAEEKQARQQRQIEASWKIARMINADFQILCGQVLNEIAAITQSVYGFLNFIDEEKRVATAQCYTTTAVNDCRVEQGAKPFSLDDAGIWVEVVRTRQPLIVNDYQADHPAKKGLPQGHLPLTRVLVVPIFSSNSLIAAVAVGNKTRDYTLEDADQIATIMTNVIAILEKRRAEKALIESEQRFRDLVENATDIIYTIDLHGNFTSINRAAEKATGYSLEEALTMNIEDVVAPEERQFVRETYRSHLGGAPPKTFETTIIGKEGHKISLEVNTRLLFKDGIPVGAQGIARDIDERKRTDLLKQDRRLALEMVAQGQPLTETLTHLVNMVERQCQNGIAVASRLHDRCLTIMAAPHLPQSCIDALNGMSVGPAAASAGTAAHRGESVIVSDIANDPLWDQYREVAASHDLRAGSAVPILSGSGHILGTFELYFHISRAPSTSELGLLEVAAGLASIATEHKELTERLAYQAQHDPLTGLPNRLLLEDRLQQAIAHAQRHGRMMALLYIDLDRFKLVNDTLGHVVGDDLLKQVAARLSGCLRKSDTLARTGGDEFTLILNDVDGLENATAIAKKLLGALKEPFQVGEHELFVAMSIGIGLYPEDGADAATIRKNADSAMYAAKSNGGNRAQKHSPSANIITESRLTLENDLHRALIRHELSLHYQPQFDLSTGALIGLEALLRWNHPYLGPIPPDKFIPIAEESGLILRIGNHVLKEACRQQECWRKAGYDSIKIAVNISASQFVRSDLVSIVKRLLSKHRLEPHCLSIELTESLIMSDVEESVSQMTLLRDLGVSISIDDFGTGYSSLSYLQYLPIDNLKIDQSFLRVLDETGSTAPVIRAIVGLAHGLGITVTAEGVELESQLKALRKIGCDYAQGYWMGKPMPAEAVEKLLASSDRRDRIYPAYVYPATTVDSEQSVAAY